MIGCLVRIGWLNLKRDRIGLLLSFVLPVIFLTIFSFIFGGTGGDSDGERAGSGSLRVLVADEDRTETSERFILALDALEAVEAVTAPAAAEGVSPAPWTRESMRPEVQRGTAPAGLVIAKGFEAQFGDFSGRNPEIELFVDASNPLASNALEGLIQAAAMQAAPDVLMEKGLGALEEFGGALTAAQREAMEKIKPLLRGMEKDGAGARGAESARGSEDSDGAMELMGAGAGGGGFTGLVTVRTSGAQRARSGPTSASMISYYAAGIGVMFLLFSMAGGAGALIEERENGTLDRLLVSRVTMGQILTGKWLFLAAMGVVQLALMFGWAALVFGLDVGDAGTIIGLSVMSIVSSAAGAAFGILLSTICRTRAQQSGISTVLILIMSAIGGSMVPRFVMPPFMGTAAKFTFNGQALDGFLNVLWYRADGSGAAEVLASIAPQVIIIALCGAAMFAAARWIAPRWAA